MAIFQVYRAAAFESVHDVIFLAVAHRREDRAPLLSPVAASGERKEASKQLARARLPPHLACRATTRGCDLLSHLQAVLFALAKGARYKYAHAAKESGRTP